MKAMAHCSSARRWSRAVSERNVARALLQKRSGSGSPVFVTFIILQKFIFDCAARTDRPYCLVSTPWICGSRRRAAITALRLFRLKSIAEKHERDALAWRSDGIELNWIADPFNPHVGTDRALHNLRALARKRFRSPARSMCTNRRVPFSAAICSMFRS
jgi:hypothetical protein